MFDVESVVSLTMVGSSREQADGHVSSAVTALVRS